VATLPQVALGSLARSLGNLGIRLRSAGRSAEAFAAAEESIEIKRRLAEARISDNVFGSEP